MIDQSQWRASIGCFNWKRANCYIGREFISSTSNVVMLHTVVTVMRDVAVLQTYIYVITVLHAVTSLWGHWNEPGPVHKALFICTVRWSLDDWSVWMSVQYTCARECGGRPLASHIIYYNCVCVLWYCFREEGVATMYVCITAAILRRYDIHSYV